MLLAAASCWHARIAYLSFYLLTAAWQCAGLHHTCGKQQDMQQAWSHLLAGCAMRPSLLPHLASSSHAGGAGRRVPSVSERDGGAVHHAVQAHLLPVGAVRLGGGVVACSATGRWRIAATAPQELDPALGRA